jgi:hypothetical protein
MKTVVALFALSLCLFSSPLFAGLIFTLSDPDIAVGPAGASNVETFDRQSRGRISNNIITDFGVYRALQGGVRINGANKWGGADGNGNYLFIPAGGAIELTFNNPVGYFGFWWSAGDAGNKLTVNTVSETLEFTTSDILNSPALTPEHFGNPFWGNPDSRDDYHASWEPFAFVNLFAETGADALTSIRFYGSNFESDNHTVLTTILPSSGAFISRVGIQSVPEPSALALFSFALLLMYRKAQKRYAVAPKLGTR